MFQGVKNQFFAKMQVEKFISSQFVKFINSVLDMLMSDMSKDEIIVKCNIIKDEIILKYNLTDKDLKNE